MSLRDRLVAQQLPTRTVTLAPVVEGAEPDVVTVRALPAPEWDALVQMHPPPDGQAGLWQWNVATFRPAALAACVVSPADEGEPLTEQDWAELLAHMTVGDRERLYGAVLDVNENRWESISEVGKG